MNLLFLNNFNLDQANNCYNPHILIAWSVAIEEQFYLIYPLIFIIGVKKKILPHICILGFLSGYIYTIFFNNDYASTFCNINFLLIGCYGAYIYYKYPKKINKSWIKSRYFLYSLIIILCLITIAVSSKRFHFTYITHAIYPIIYLLIILNCVSNDSTSKFEVSNFSSLGKYTYGMYLYHPMILVCLKIIFDKQNWNYLENPHLELILSIISLIITIIVSIVSFKYFEKFFLSYKQKFSIVKTRLS